MGIPPLGIPLLGWPLDRGDVILPGGDGEGHDGLGLWRFPQQSQ